MRPSPVMASTHVASGWWKRHCEHRQHLGGATPVYGDKPRQKTSMPGQCGRAGAMHAVLAVAVCSRGRKTPRPPRPHIVLKAARELEETEAVFREAFEAQASRCELLAQTLQELDLADEDGLALRQSQVKALKAFSPDVPGGKASWKEAFEAAKDVADLLEKDVEKARPSATSTSTTRDPEDVGDGGSAPSAPSAAPSARVVVEDGEAVQKLEALAEKVIDDEATLRFIAVPVLVPENEKKEAKLPPLGQVREVLSKDLFRISSEVIFERVFILEGQAMEELNLPAVEVLTRMQQRMVTAGLDDTVEIFLQRCIDPSKIAVLVMLKEDMPSDEFAWWQWLLCALAFLGTLITVNIDGFSVSAVTMEQMKVMSVEEMMTIANQTLPTAVSILSVVLSMEVARRAAAAKFDVGLTPPVFVPVWPFPSVGCFGAITRQQSIVPNEDANLSMSVAAGLAGYAVSFLLLLIGLAIGSGENQISLSYQILPLALKLLLRPMLGEPSATEQLDPFNDPVNVAFPASPILIGGVVGIVITSLNLLSLGRLDGKVLARALRGPGNVAGFLSLAILVSGSLDNASNLLYATFASYAIILQGGYNCPARDSVTEPDPGLRTAAAALVVAGIVLSIPGSLIPGI